MPEGYAIQAIQAVLSGQRAYCKFLAANDTGLTGGHQAGIYISKPSIPILFDEPGIKGTNKEKWVKVKWQDGIETDTRFIYYGKGTRNEYRITNFGRGFPFLRPEYTGALFVFTKCGAEDYQAFVLNSEEDIDQFLDAFGISPTETNQLIDAGRVQEETQERIAIQEFIAGVTVDFPLSEEMSAAARDIQNRVYDHLEFIRTNPDRKIIDWTNTEYALFRAIEHARYGDAIARGFTSVDEFITMANMVLNRRKSRAGKSLEHHLSAIFDGNEIIYTAQAVTEGNKKPDFIFPSQASYEERRKKFSSTDQILRGWDLPYFCPKFQPLMQKITYLSGLPNCLTSLQTCLILCMLFLIVSVCIMIRKRKLPKSVHSPKMKVGYSLRLAE